MPNLKRRPSLIFKRLGWHLVLALSMLLLQQGGIRHALQHAVNDDAAPAHSTLCKDCLSYCANDVLAPQTTATALLDTLIDSQVATGQAQRPQTTETGYQSRAPPSLLPWS